jgi:hypothetical protein
MINLLKKSQIDYDIAKNGIMAVDRYSSAASERLDINLSYVVLVFITLPY